jgi:hypothetical protein
MRFVIKKFPMPDLMSLYFMELEEKTNFTFSKNGLFHNYKTPVIVNSIKIYPQYFFSPVTTYNNCMMISAFTKNTCLCHHFAATWKSSENDTFYKLFSVLLKENNYIIAPSLIPELKKRYILPNKIRNPLWALNENEKMKIEKILNFLIPYDGILYHLFKKIRKT